MIAWPAPSSYRLLPAPPQGFRPMRHFPIFLDLAGRTALVLGAGAIALRKEAALARAGAHVRPLHAWN